LGHLFNLRIMNLTAIAGTLNASFATKAAMTSSEGDLQGLRGS